MEIVKAELPNIERLAELNKHLIEDERHPNPMSIAEMQLVNEIFSVPHFRASLPDRTRLGNNPFADPFVIAQAKVMNYCVVTQESEKPHAARIPNICGHFDVDWTNLKGFMERENWSF